MNIDTPLVADTQAPEPMEPAQRSLDHPTPAAQVLLAFDASPGDAWSDAPLSQPLAVAPIVVALVSVQLGRTFSGPARQPRNRWKCPHQRLQRARVMNIDPRQRRYQWQPTLIDDDVVLATELSPVRGIGAGLIPAEGGEGTLADSILASFHSICSYWRNLWSTALCRRCQTPACCQSRRRLQHVIPQPQPSSLGKYSQGIPVCRTYRMPVKAARSVSRGRDRPWARVCGPAAAVQ